MSVGDFVKRKGGINDCAARFKNAVRNTLGVLRGGKSYLDFCYRVNQISKGSQIDPQRSTNWLTPRCCCFETKNADFGLIGSGFNFS